MLEIAMLVVCAVFVLLFYLFVRAFCRFVWFVGALESHSMKYLAIMALENGYTVKTEGSAKKMSGDVTFKPPLAMRKSKPWYF